jgi:hypothetical protein
MKLSYIILAIVTSILIILITLLIHIDPHLEVETVSFDDIKSNLKTGDVLITFGNTLKSAGVRWYIQSAATHVGMIVKLDPEIFDSSTKPSDDNLYVLDIGPHSFFSILGDRDVKLRPLSKVLRSRNCISIFGILPIDKEIEISPEDIINYSSYSYDFCFPLVSPKKITKYKICSSFISQIHEDKKINLSIIKDPDGLTPKDYFEHPDTYFFTR